MKIILYLLVIVSFSFSCVQEIDITPPTQKSKVVLMGFINPDSVLKVNVKLTNTTNEKVVVFPEVKYVKFYENNNLIIESVKTKINDEYYADYYPKVGNLYKVEVITEEYGIVSAEDSLIKNLNIEFKGRIKTAREIENPFYEVILKNINQNAYLTIRKKELNKIIQFDILSDSNWLDPLGSYYDYRSGLGKIYEILYVRLDDKAKGQKIVYIPFSIASGKLITSNVGDMVTLEVISGSNKLDKYLKSLMINSTGKLYNPFAEPSPTYSNVDSGLGYFVYVYRQTFKLD
jgi:hypothetical protein